MVFNGGSVVIRLNYQFTEVYLEKIGKNPKSIPEKYFWLTTNCFVFILGQ